MHDADIRRQLRTRLEREFGNDPTALILDELGVCCGRVRADMAVVNGELKGFEIKSDQDTLLRLRSQAAFYGKVFDTVSIVVAPKYLEKARKIVPSWWGIWRVEDGVDSIPRIDIYRSERDNPKPDPISIAQLIWRDEAFELLKAHHLHFGLRNKPRKFLWMALVDFFPLEHLRMLVRSQLKMRRDWRSAGSNMRYDVKSPPVSKSSDSHS
jgi:hypothetical protein